MIDIVRKTVLHVEDIHTEAGGTVDPPLRMIGAAAVIRNPWHGRGFVFDLKPETIKYAAPLGAELARIIVEAAGGGDRVEAYGKAAVIGSNGDIEHGRALIHQLRFGNQYREAVAAESYLNSANTKGGPGAPVHIPLLHKYDDSKRSHFITIQMSIPDAPGPDEIVLALGATTGPSPNHRIGDRFSDIEEIKSETES